MQGIETISETVVGELADLIWQHSRAKNIVRLRRCVPAPLDPTSIFRTRSKKKYLFSCSNISEILQGYGYRGACTCIRFSPLSCLVLYCLMIGVIFYL